MHRKLSNRMFKTTNKEAITLISQGQIMDLATIFFSYSGALNSQARRVWGNKNIDSSFLLDSEKIPSSLVKRSWSIRVFNSISGTSTTCIKCTPPFYNNIVRAGSWSNAKQPELGLEFQPQPKSVTGNMSIQVHDLPPGQAVTSATE